MIPLTDLVPGGSFKGVDLGMVSRGLLAGLPATLRPWAIAEAWRIANQGRFGLFERSQLEVNVAHHLPDTAGHEQLAAAVRFLALVQTFEYTPGGADKGARFKMPGGGPGPVANVGHGTGGKATWKDAYGKHPYGGYDSGKQSVGKYYDSKAYDKTYKYDVDKTYKYDGGLSYKDYDGKMIEGGSKSGKEALGGLTRFQLDLIGSPGGAGIVKSQG